MPEHTQQTPCVSLNALARYLTATQAAWGRRIVSDQKRAQTFRLNNDEPAAHAILDFLIAGAADGSPLVGGIARLEGLTPHEEYEEAWYRTNSEALAAFMDHDDRLRLKRCRLERLTPDQTPPDLVIEEVSVEIRPDLILRHAVEGQPVVGALKLYFSKAEPLTRAFASYATALLLRHVRERLANPGGPVRAADCLVFDILQGRLHKAPSGVVRRFDDIESTCREIALH